MASQRIQAARDEAIAQQDLSAGNIAGYNQYQSAANYHAGKPESSFLGGFLNNPFTQVLTDVALTATGNPEFIPVANAAETATGDLANGQGLGTSLEQGAISGGEALAGQELAGAFGIGSGNPIFNNALGITGDNPAGTFDIDLGSSFNNTLSGLGLSSSASPDLATPAATSGAAVDPNLDQINLTPSGGSTLSPSSGGFDLNGNPVATAGAVTPPTSTNPLTNTPSFGSNVMNGDILTALKQAGVSPMQLLAAGGVGVNALMGNKKTGAQQAQAGLAGQTSAEANNLITSGNAGTLPAGQLQVLQTQLADTITGIRSKFAQFGMSGSTAEQAEIANAQTKMANDISTMAMNEVSTGLSALGQASDANTAIANQQVSEDTALQKAIATLAGIPSSIGKPQQQQAA